MWQLLATIIATVGAIMLTYGLSLFLFSSQLGIDSIQASDENKNNLEIFSKMSSNQGLMFQITGLILLFVVPLIMIFVIIKEKVKQKENKLSKVQILFDEMYDGKDLELKEKGYETFSVKKLRLEGKPLRWDFSVLKYVEENKMVLITEDPENYGGCQENNLPCIKLGQNPSIEEIIKEIEFISKRSD